MARSPNHRRVTKSGKSLTQKHKIDSITVSTTPDSHSHSQKPDRESKASTSHSPHHKTDTKNRKSPKQQHKTDSIRAITTPNSHSHLLQMKPVSRDSTTPTITSAIPKSPSHHPTAIEEMRFPNQHDDSVQKTGTFSREPFNRLTDQTTEGFNVSYRHLYIY